jgi:hypothetical protein
VFAVLVWLLRDEEIASAIRAEQNRWRIFFSFFSFSTMNENIVRSHKIQPHTSDKDAVSSFSSSFFFFPTPPPVALVTHAVREFCFVLF